MALSSVNAAVKSVLSCKTTLNDAQLGDAINIVDQVNGSRELTSSSTPAITKIAYGTITLSNGAATLDLAATTGVNGETVDLSGLKVQAFAFKAGSSNTSDITVSVGATNGLNLDGSAGFSMNFQAGDFGMWSGNETSQDVGASDKTIDFAGTGSETIDFCMVAG